MEHYLNWEFNLISGIDSAFWKLKNRKPYEMTTTGINIFCGPQGSGKTLSLVHYLKKLLKDFPKAIIVTNMELNFPIEQKIIPYTGFNDFKLENGIYGVIYVLDEIHLILNSLESK